MAYKWLISLVWVALASAPAAAQTVTAKDPKALAAFLKQKGYRAEVKEKPTGAHIESSDSGIAFSIFFMNCAAAGSDCKTIQFFNGYTDIDGVPLTRINEWNKKHRFARAYIDDGQDPVLEMDVDLDNGGMAAVNFVEQLKIWTTLMGEYRRFLLEKR
jgi:hypothetical protein